MLNTSEVDQHVHVEFPEIYQRIISQEAYNRMVVDWQIPRELVHNRIDIFASYASLYNNIPEKVKLFAQNPAIVMRNGDLVVPFFHCTNKRKEGGHCADLANNYFYECQVSGLNHDFVKHGLRIAQINLRTVHSNHSSFAIIDPNVQLSGEVPVLMAANQIVVEDPALLKIDLLSAQPTGEFKTIKIQPKFISNLVTDNPRDLPTIDIHFQNISETLYLGSLHSITKSQFISELTITSEGTIDFGSYQSEYLGISQDKNAFFQLGWVQLSGLYYPFLMIEDNIGNLPSEAVMIHPHNPNRELIDEQRPLSKRNKTAISQVLKELKKFELSHLLNF